MFPTEANIPGPRMLHRQNGVEIPADPAARTAVGIPAAEPGAWRAPAGRGPGADGAPRRVRPP